MEISFEQTKETSMSNKEMCMQSPQVAKFASLGILAAEKKSGDRRAISNNELIDIKKIPVGKLKVLLVDDEELICEFLELVLADHFEVTAVSNSEVALKLIYTERFDVVITDIKMPKVSGDTIAIAVRSEQPHAHLIIMSGNLRGNLPVSLLACEPFLFLAKPFSSPKELKEEIFEFVNREKESCGQT